MRFFFRLLRFFCLIRFYLQNKSHDVWLPSVCTMYIFQCALCKNALFWVSGSSLYHMNYTNPYHH